MKAPPSPGITVCGHYAFETAISSLGGAISRGEEDA